MRWLRPEGWVLLAGGAASAACSHGAAPLARRGAGFELREGHRLYASYCAPCHGETGRGDGTYLSATAPAAPPDFGTPGARERIRGPAIGARLDSVAAQGETHCPPWGGTLHAAQREAVAAFVATLSEPPAE